MALRIVRPVYMLVENAGVFYLVAQTLSESSLGFHICFSRPIDHTLDRPSRNRRDNSAGIDGLSKEVKPIEFDQPLLAHGFASGS